MRKILVLQHVASEPLGHLDALLRRSGIRIRYVNFGRDPHARPDVARYDGLVVLGGPMNVDQVDHHPHLRTEIDVIREAVQRGKPVLGVCLGAQLLAAAMGAAVHLASTRNCRNQAYRIGDHAWGLQFHLEADDALISRWLASERGQEEISNRWHARRIAQIRADSRLRLPATQPLSDRVFGEFVELVRPRARSVTLPSR